MVGRPHWWGGICLETWRKLGNESCLFWEKHFLEAVKCTNSEAGLCLTCLRTAKRPVCLHWGWITGYRGGIVGKLVEDQVMSGLVGWERYRWEESLIPASSISCWHYLHPQYSCLVFSGSSFILFNGSSSKHVNILKHPLNIKHTNHKSKNFRCYLIFLLPLVTKTLKRVIFGNPYNHIPKTKPAIFKLLLKSKDLFSTNLTLVFLWVGIVDHSPLEILLYCV